MVMGGFFKRIFKESGKGREPNKNASVEPAGMVPLNPTQTHVKIHDGSTSVSLWDTAYDGLKEEEETRKLLSTYEDLLSRVPIKGSGHYSELIP